MTHKIKDNNFITFAFAIYNTKTAANTLNSFTMFQREHALKLIFQTCSAYKIHLDFTIFSTICAFEMILFWKIGFSVQFLCIWCSIVWLLAKVNVICYECDLHSIPAFVINIFLNTFNTHFGNHDQYIFEIECIR